MRKGFPRRFTVLFLGYSLFLSGVAVLGPNRNVYLVRDLGMSRTMAGLFDFVGILSLALLQPLAGSLSDKYGRKTLMVLASLGLMIGLVNLYFAESFLQAVVSAALFAGYSSYRLAASAYISDRTECGEERWSVRPSQLCGVGDAFLRGDNRWFTHSGYRYSEGYSPIHGLSCIKRLDHRLSS